MKQRVMEAAGGISRRNIRAVDADLLGEYDALCYTMTIPLEDGDEQQVAKVRELGGVGLHAFLAERHGDGSTLSEDHMKVVLIKFGRETQAPSPNGGTFRNGIQSIT